MLIYFQRCCANNQAGIISILIQESKANINERNPKTGWIPLHEAAFSGHLECIRVISLRHSHIIALERVYQINTIFLHENVCCGYLLEASY